MPTMPARSCLCSAVLTLECDTMLQNDAKCYSRAAVFGLPCLKLRGSRTLVCSHRVSRNGSNMYSSKEIRESNCWDHNKVYTYM